MDLRDEVTAIAHALVQLERQVQVQGTLSFWEEQRQRSERNAGGWMEPYPKPERTA